MKRAIIKGAVIGVVFFAALIIIGAFVNRGNNDLTVEMAKATYPLVYMLEDDQRYNALHGNKKAMDTSFERDNFTILDENRTVEAVIETFGNEIEEIFFEVRSVDGERLVESTKITGYEEKEGALFFKIALKDLIERDTEYCLVILVTPKDGETIRYYTRAIWAEDYNAAEKLDFVRYFHRCTFSKESAANIKRYLESNSEGDNTTFNKVNIHSSLSQVTWGDLNVTKLEEPIPEIKEIASQTASITMNYSVSTGSGKNRRYYLVEEFYRIRYTSDRVYLLDFERSMEQLLWEDNVPFENNKLNLGIISQEFDFVESEDGNIIVFENLGRLFSYNINDNKLSLLFGFYDAENTDKRAMYQKHRIKVLNVDEAGNIQFVVYGYMNRGRHEGDVGIQVYLYNATLNTVEEAVYIPYGKSADILMEQMQKLVYLNRNNVFFLMLEGSVYAVDLVNKTYEELVEDVKDGSIQVSDSGKMIVWQKVGDLYSCTELLLMDLNTRRQIQISAEASDYIMPMGFMDEDLIYGLARRADITNDSAGRTIFPMYTVCIQNVNGEILKRYQQDNTYVTGWTLGKNQITLNRIRAQEDGSYATIGDDQIMSSQAEDIGKNEVQIINTEHFEKQVQIAFKENIDKKGLKVLTPKEVLFEGGRELQLLQEESERARFYVYGTNGVKGIFMNPADAVALAYECNGSAIDDAGAYIFRKINRVSRNQIMAITGEAVTEENNSLSVCLNTILGFEGVVLDTATRLAMGESPYQILSWALSDYHVMDLTGCSLDTVLYYVNFDIPVLALLENGEAILVIGFNETQIALMDPRTGTIYKKGISDSAEWFEKNGNCFITYVK